tara:strand:+ start:2693 stop:5140 length:2448 start_codon:yes stop_codon:yes gene_type:complete
MIVGIKRFIAVCGTAIIVTAPAINAQSMPERALLDRYCVSCHNDRLRTANLALDEVDMSAVGTHAATLEKVVRKLRAGQMPPPGRPRPKVADIETFVSELEDALDRSAADAPNPGRIVVHRMTRLEYVNAILDVFALEIDPAILPVDDPGIGFDNNADILSVTPALMARYLSAATKISRLAIGNDQDIRPATQIYRASEFAYQEQRMGEEMPFGTHGGISAHHVFPLDAEYEFKMRLQRNNLADTIRGMDEEHEIQVRLDHALVERFSVGGAYQGFDFGMLNAIPEDDIENQRLHTYRLTADDHLAFRLPVKAGNRLVTASFTDRAPRASEGIPLVPASRNFWIFGDDAAAPGIATLEIAGPYAGTVPEDTLSRQQIFKCRPTTEQETIPCAQEILRNLARRAYRRPLVYSDMDELMRLFTIGSQDKSFDEGIELALEGMLSSPSFLFRIEHDPDTGTLGENYHINDVELASRLSFFLWKSVPDEELLSVAESGKLSDPEVLEQQTQRLLADPKSKRWMTDFMEQWLTVRNLEGHAPNPDRFIEFDDNLREAMQFETQLFFTSQIQDDQNVLELLTADYTYLNERLAKHYGVPGIYGSHFRRVQMNNPDRKGLLGHSSILTVTSYADRTSVVVRGKWVLETLLGSPPPPPPPNVPELVENRPGQIPTSLRERMEQHRANPVCSGCHAPMDPLGFVLENFDATGQWRNSDAGIPIDARGTVTGGLNIDGPAAFREYLLSRGDEIIYTLTEKLLSYALGRGLEYYDAPTVRELVRNASNNNYRWSSLIFGIVKSLPFQMRQIEQVEETTSTNSRAQL